MIVSELIAETQHMLYGVHRGNLNFTAQALDDEDTDFSLADDPKGVAQGTLLSVDDELMLVRQASQSSKTVTVKRGWLGTEQVEHTAGSLVEVNPRFPRIEVRRALRDEIRSWGTGMFQVITEFVDITSSTRSVDLSVFDEGWFHILRATRTARTGSDADVAVRFRTHTASADHPFGSLVLEEAPGAAVTLSITVAAPFSVGEFTDDLDLNEDIGLEESMFDIPKIGACWRLLSPREINRLDTTAQDEPRSAADVQAGMIAATARGYKQLRDTRLADESTRLRGRWPWRF